MMKINLLAFGIAKDILATKQTSLEVAEGTSIGDLKNTLIRTYPALQQLKSLSFAVGKEYQTDDFLLKAEDEVIIIPPVSGG
ncbi:MAG: MoaD/ThiS family protein [Bacteroidota bacterium]